MHRELEETCYTAERVAQPRAMPVRVLALMEATTLTGPAKNLVQFASAARLEREGVPPAEMSVVAFVRGDSQSNGFIDAVRAAGIEVDVVRERFVYDASVVAQLRCIVEKHQPDIIQTHNIKSHFLTRIARLHAGSKWIAFQHGYTSTDLKDRAYSQLDRWSLARADHIVTVCGVFAKQLRQRGIAAEKITVRHNMVRPFVRCNQNEAHLLRERLRIPSESVVLFTAGRLSREKGHVDLVDAIACMRGMTTRCFRLIIAGAGPEQERIEQRIRKHGLGETVRLVGHQTDLRAYYSIADIAVLPSHSEGSPNMLLEAMAAGLPCVATKVGGVPEIVCDGRDALLVPANNPPVMANAIKQLIDDTESRARLGVAAQIDARKYTYENYTSAVLKLYRAVLRNVQV